MNDIVKAARRLLNALNSLEEGCTERGLLHYENGLGEPVGLEIEAAREQLEESLPTSVKPKQHCSGFWNEAFGDES